MKLVCKANPGYAEAEETPAGKPAKQDKSEESKSDLHGLGLDG